MGVIVKQSIKGSIYSYIGAAIGFVNTALLFPLYFSTGQIGLLFLLISVSLVFAQLFSLGFGGVANRFFPYFINDKNGHNGFPFIMLATTITGILVFLVVFYFISPVIIEQNSNSPEFVHNVNLIIYITIIEIFFKMFNSYTTVLLNSVIGTFYKELVLRLFILLLIVAFILNIIDYDAFLYLYILAQAIPVIALFIYLLKKRELKLKPKLKFITPHLKKAMIYMALVSSITGLTGIAYQSIDKYMINSMIDLSNTGVYTIAFFLGSIIGLPARSLKKIASVIIARAWKEDDLGTVKDIYVKSSLSLTVIGSFIFLGIMINIDNVIDILGSDYANSKLVIFFVGLSFLIDLIFGVNYHVISNSRYYQYIAYLMGIFLLIVVVSNYFLIPKYGIQGAAFASMASTLFYSLLKYLFVLFKFKIQPFCVKHFVFLAIVAVLFAVFYSLPSFVSNPYVNIIIKSTIFTFVFIPSAYFLRISDDINDKILWALGFLKKGVKR